MDAARVAVNFILGIGQIALSIWFFRDGFETAASAFPKSPPTPLEPAGYAFAIWTPIYLGSVAFALHQAFGRNWSDPVYRSIGWWTALAFLCCCLWLVFAKHGPVFATVPAIIVMFIALLWSLIVALGLARDGAAVSPWFTIAPLALYAGWLTIAVFANVAEILSGYGIHPFGLSQPTFAGLLLLIALPVALTCVFLVRGNMIYASAITWALVAIAVANIQRGPNLVFAVLAGGSAVLAILVSLNARTM